MEHRNSGFRVLEAAEIEAVAGGWGEEPIPDDMEKRVLGPTKTYRNPDGTSVTIMLGEGSGYYSESREVYYGGDGKVYKDFQSCVDQNAQQFQDDSTNFLGSFGPVGYLADQLLEGRTPSDAAINYGIMTCY